MDALKKIRDLSPEEVLVLNRLLWKLRSKAERNRLRSDYREAKRTLQKIGFSIPPHMRDFASVLDWPDKAVKVPSRHVRPEDFTLTHASTLLSRVEEILLEPEIQSLERMAIESSMEHSVAFLFVTPGDKDAGEPEAIITARTALEATVEIDPRTRKVTAALESISTTRHLLYLPGVTLRVELDNYGYVVTKEMQAVEGRVTVTPYVWERSIKRPLGHSRISRPLMGYTDAGVRTFLRQETNAEFYGAPQRTLMGADKAHFTDSQGKRISPLEALIGGVWGLPDVRDEETGDLVRPTLQQLQQASMQPHGEMLRGIAMMVSSATSIPASYLGVITDNPSSADAIRAAEADLIALVESELPSIGAARVDLARNVAAVLDGEWTATMERDLRGLQSNFGDPGTLSRAARADAGLKYIQAFPDGDPEVAMEEYGLSPQQIERNLKHINSQKAAQSVTNMLLAARGSGQPQQDPATPPAEPEPEKVGAVSG